MSIKVLQETLDMLQEQQSQLERESILADRSESWKLQKRIEECEKKREKIKNLIAEFKKEREDSFLDIPENISPETIANLPTDPGERSIPVKGKDFCMYSEGQNSAHLSVAIFQSGNNDQTIYIQHRLFYYKDGELRTIKLVLPEEEDVTNLKQVPQSLRVLSQLAESYLAKYFSKSEDPFYLNIELFLPTEMLGIPLSRWCGTHADLLEEYPIVLGCSDRFNPLRPEIADSLLNKMKKGWQRFQRDIPDHSIAALNNLNWLDSDQAMGEFLDKYSGFRCYGEWLKSDNKCLNNWRELIKSGISISLWMCEGTPQRDDIELVFDRLTALTRFEFLEEIRIIRGEQRRNCNHRVGVFYEDLNYVLKFAQVPFVWPAKANSQSGRTA